MNKSRNILFPSVSILLIIALSLFATAGCQSQKKEQTIILATTTSIQDSGLLSFLLPKFTAETGIKVKPIALGSGEALKMGVRGDADIILAHSPDDEKQLVADNKLKKRTSFMFNFFTIVGPKNDPAKISSLNSAEEGFAKINKTNNLFVSRADESGTHKKELKIWDKAKIKPSGDRYIKTGQGMAESLNIANDKNAYILSDKATFISLKKSIENLNILLTNSKDLKNTYSVVEIKKYKNSNIKDAASKFKTWILSKKTLNLIVSFGEKKYDEPLFQIKK